MSHCLAQERCWLACPHRLLQIGFVELQKTSISSAAMSQSMQAFPRLKVFFAC